VRAAVKRICEYCYVARRRGKLFVYCKKNPKVLLRLDSTLKRASQLAGRGVGDADIVSLLRSTSRGSCTTQRQHTQPCSMTAVSTASLSYSSSSNYYSSSSCIFPSGEHAATSVTLLTAKQSRSPATDALVAYCRSLLSHRHTASIGELHWRSSQQQQQQQHL
jgi:ribosomal protein L36